MTEYSVQWIVACAVSSNRLQDQVVVLEGYAASRGAGCRIVLRVGRRAGRVPDYGAAAPSFGKVADHATLLRFDVESLVRDSLAHQE